MEERPATERRSVQENGKIAHEERAVKWEKPLVPPGKKV